VLRNLTDPPEPGAVRRPLYGSAEPDL